MGSDMKKQTHMKLSRRTLLRHFTVMTLAGADWLAMASVRAQDGRRAQLILVVGDSLSAEYGLARGTGWVALLGRQLLQDKVNATVVNASISGDTSSGGLSRLPALLKRHQPTLVVIALGANDALRGLPLAATRDNLTAMARAAKACGAKVLVVGMQIPPNYGKRYADDFSALFANVAKAESAGLVPFLLKGVADAPNKDQLFQADRIHPREQAQPTLLANVWSGLKPLLR